MSNELSATDIALRASMVEADQIEAAKLAKLSAYPKQHCVNCGAVCSRNEFGDVVCGNIDCHAFNS